MRRLVAVLVATIIVAPTVGSAETVGEWIVRDQALGKQNPGPVTADNPQFQALHAPIIAALRLVREAANADRAAGRASTICFPPPGTVTVESRDVGHWLYSLPPTEHGKSLVEAMTAFARERFPCSAGAIAPAPAVPAAK